MKESFVQRLRNGERLAGVWSGIDSQAAVETLAYEFDFVVIDGEHSEHGMSDIAALVRAVEASNGDAVPLVRVSEANNAELRRVLDFGPAGVIVPQIADATEAREAIEATRYPPAGVRGVAGGRASEYGRSLESYYEAADDQVATILQVETAGIVEEIEDVVGFDGLDGLFIGPADLSAQLGCFGAYESETFLDAIDHVVEAADAAGVPVGTLATSTENVDVRDDWGVDFMALGTDLGYLRRSAAAFTEAYDQRE